MDDGELQLNNGDVTSFRDALIIMTSNLGAKEMAASLSGLPLGFAGRDRQASTDQLEEVAKKSFKEHFRPEFINRLTEMVVFHPLDRDGLGQVLDSKLALTNTEYESELGARISISQAVRDYLIDIAARELHMGARPLVRALDSNIYTAFGRYWGSNAIAEGTHVRVFHRSELGQAMADDESPLVFASKADNSIRKRQDPKALVAAFSNQAAAGARETEPEEVEPEPEEE
jgi:ATP-dependent Clp protease ATP-binding subunit ClpC